MVIFVVELWCGRVLSVEVEEEDVEFEEAETLDTTEETIERSTG